jgi:hypothetical protein
MMMMIMMIKMIMMMMVMMTQAAHHPPHRHTTSQAAALTWQWRRPRSPRRHIDSNSSYVTPLPTKVVPSHKIFICMPEEESTVSETQRKQDFIAQ